MSVCSSIIKMLAATIVASLLFAAIVSGQRDISQWIEEDPAGAAPLKDRDSTLQPLLCGTQYYDPLKYTCFDNSQLCPWQNGYPQDRCGVTNKCFLPFRYDCNNGNLMEIPRASGPFELVAINLQEIAYVRVQACGNAFWLKSGRACTLCPSQVGNACPPGVDTVLTPGRSMDTLVPGGQRYYIEPKTGALRFSVAHSGVDAPGAIYDIHALQNGTFAKFPYDNWVACQPHGNETTVHTDDGSIPWKIFAKLPALPFSADCIPVNLVTVPWQAPANQSAAAWEYI